MSSIVRLLILCIAFYCCCLASIYGQKLKPKIEELYYNVVEIRSISKDASEKRGYGFIVGRNRNTVYIVTAFHTIDFSAENDSLKYIDAFFYKKPGSLRATSLKNWTEDISLLKVEINEEFNWKKDALAPEINAADDVSFVVWGEGRKGAPADRKISTIDQLENKILFYRVGVERGISGAPLVNENGIIGMITSNDIEEAFALDIKRIEARIKADYDDIFQLEVSIDKKQANLDSRKSKDINPRGMIRLPGGAFLMGQGEAQRGQDNEEHLVTVKPFFLNPYEVSINDYNRYLSYTRTPKKSNKGMKGTQPVVDVSWWDAINYCNWLSDRDSLERCYTIGKGDLVTFNPTQNGYRLPTEAEWEYAARDGGKNRLFGNSSDQTTQINFSDLKLKKAIETSKGSPSQLGFFHLSGNVAEWCWDYYDSDYYSQSPPEHPIGPENGELRVVRGGSWKSGANEIKTFVRNKLIPKFGYPMVGFRIARNAY